MILLAVDVLQRVDHRSRSLGRLGVRVRSAPFLEGIGDLLAEASRGHAEVRFEDLPDIHAAGHTQRVEHDIDMRPVFEERHVLDRQDAADHALVAVAAGHLVARLQLALHRDKDLDHLEHARRKFVTALELLLAVVEFGVDDLDGLVVLALDRLELRLAPIVGDSELEPLVALDALDQLVCKLNALLDALGRGRSDLARQHVLEAVVGRPVEDRALVLAVLAEAFDFLVLDGARTIVDLDAVAVKHAHLDDRAGHTRRQLQRGIAHVARLFAEDGAQELFLRRHRAFALGRDLADQDVARVHFGTDVDDARLVEVAQGLLADVGNVAGDVLGPELGVARHDLELLDMDRGEHVILYDTLGNEDRIFVVVAVPRHEGDEAVAAQRQFAEVGGGPVGDDVTGLDHIAHLYQRALVDAGVLVRALELLQRVDIDARTARLHIADRADHNAGGIHLIDHAAASRGDRRARIARHGFFHARAHEGCLGLNQRHRLALHVRAHQRAVRVVVLKKRNQRRGDRHELLGAHVHQRDLLARGHEVVAILARRDEFLDEAAVFGQPGRSLRHGVLLFLHRRQIDHLAGDLAILDGAVRRLDEAVFVDARKGAERVNETDVRAFGRLDRADATVMRGMHVAHFEARALAGETARPER